MTEPTPITTGMLGKLEPRLDPRTLRLARYLDASALPAPPASRNWSSAVPTWGMMANDRLGDCTCAAVGHQIQAWTQDASGREVTISDADVVAAYAAITGYNPQTGQGDNGAYELDVLNYWRHSGVGGHTLSAYAALDVKSRDHIKASINLFGSAYIGVALPRSAQSQQVWDVPAGGLVGDGAPGSWGGHGVIVLDYDANYLTCVTWGELKWMTWAFWEAYCDEAYALLGPEWFNGQQQAPNGFNLAQLQADLAAIPGNDPVDPTPTPPVPVPPTPVPPTPVPPAPSTRLLGLDVSNWNKTIDWNAVAGGGAQFAIAKASEGTTYLDPYFAANWDAMHTAGIVRGAYHFAQPDLNTPEAEAAFFLKAVTTRPHGFSIDLQPGDLLVLDIEAGSGNVANWCIRWLAAVEAAVGFKPLIYSGMWFMQPHGLLNNATLGQYGLWLAAYQTAEPATPPGWDFWALWQFASNGQAPGVAGQVDLDYFNGSRDQLLKYGKPAVVPPPVPPTPPTPPTPDPLEPRVTMLERTLASLVAEYQALEANVTAVRAGLVKTGSS